MKERISRRDFLKLAGLVPLNMAMPGFVHTLLPTKQVGKLQNVVVIVFDAFSARNISLYGYERETTPNMARLAERAVVYHNHYAGGNFTTPGTASLLTGTLPWTHRAIGWFDEVEKTFVEKNIFSAFRNHYRLAYTHNPGANRFLTQFQGRMNDHIPLSRLFLSNGDMINALFRGDEDTATVSWVRAMKKEEEGYAYSLFLSNLFEAYREKLIVGMREQFPFGPPHINPDKIFLLEDAIDWLRDNLGTVPEPFMGYFHFMPPHDPYNTHRDFIGHFDGDGLLPPLKPLDILSKSQSDIYEFILRKRTRYDKFILYVDREFGRLMNEMEKSGLLENTWVVLTSDHGEIFERGIFGHWTPVLYEPLVRVPLLIFEPGRKERTDVYTNTSVVDVLPTLLHVTGQQPAHWSDGLILPPFSKEVTSPERNIFMSEAKMQEPNEPLTDATIALVKGKYKIMYFIGYEKLLGKERVELYDLERDPEEFEDLSLSKPETTAELLNELKTKLKEKNEPYN
jgi:arylsulfatase A-like enzyme